MDEQLIEAWAIHDRIHRYLLTAVTEAGLEATAGGKGRTVGEQFAHVHNVRLMWLGAAAPDLASDLVKLDKEEPLGKAVLDRSLAVSGEAIAVLLRRSLAGGGRVKGFKPHVPAFLAYLIAHESHHRGQIVLTLKLAGHAVERKVLYGLWEWGTR
jgi:uncharacterized damage-inducible protein DinB